MTKRLLWLSVFALAGCFPANPEKNVRLADIHYRLGVHELHQNRALSAVKELQIALKHDPENADAHMTMGFIFQGRKQLDKAIEHLQLAIKYRADFADALNNLGTLYIEVGRYREALPLFQKALGVVTYATPYLPHGNIGWVQYKLGDLAAAKKSFKTALFHNPKFCLGHNNLGVVYAAEGQHALARQHFKKALDLCPKYVEAHYRLGLAHLKTQERGLALSQFQACADLAPESNWGQECSRYSKLLR